MLENNSHLQSDSWHLESNQIDIFKDFFPNEEFNNVGKLVLTFILLWKIK